MSEDASVEISVTDLAARRAAGDVQIVDCRTDDEWDEERISGSRHIELNELAAAAESIGREQAVVFVCSGGSRSAMAAEAFRTSGFDAYSLAGGLTAWSEQGQDLEQ
ncbi:MAG TPA: rhodanese-like domain-containing protein [Solirubrobacterales bacterium]